MSKFSEGPWVATHSPLNGYLIEQMRETLKALNLHLALLRPVLKVEEMPK